MRNNNVLIVGFCLSALVVACAQPEHEGVSTYEAVSESKSLGSKSGDQKLLKSSDETPIDKIKMVIRNKQEKNTERPTLLGKRTIFLNDEKYIFEGEKLQKGSKVRNIHM
jgi:hypothetical protein